MVRDEIKEPLIWYWLMFYLVEFEKDDEAENTYEKAVRIWPEKAAFFQKALRVDEEG
jgi:hypothetical protein